MATKASVPIAKASELVQETSGGGTRWSAAQLLAWWNEWERVCCSLVPRAYVVTEAVTLTANETKQAAPAGATQLVDVYRNLGTDGATPGRPITLATRAQLEQDLNWHDGTGEAAIKCFVYDERNPLIWWCYPRAHASTVVQVEVASAKLPDPLTDAGTDDINIVERFEPAGVCWIAYRALIRESEATPAYGRALELRDDAFRLIGTALDAQTLHSLLRREQLDHGDDPAPPPAMTGPG